MIRRPPRSTLDRSSAASDVYKRQLPKPRGFAEPRKTDHLFKAIVPSTAKKVKIVVTDRFGKKFTATHKI